MRIASLDHVVLTVSDIEASVAFYCGVLGMRDVDFGGGRRAVAFGSQRIHLHQRGREFEPKAERPTPGSGDLCFLVADLEDAAATLARHGVAVEVGPVDRDGAAGALRSLYVRDPDANLVELAEVVAAVRPGKDPRSAGP